MGGCAERVGVFEVRGVEVTVEHKPYVMPLQLVTEQWVVRCDCGLYEQFNAESDANGRASEHKESGT